MNLDDPALFARLDPENWLAGVEALPEALCAAWERGQTLPLPAAGAIERVVVAAMGASALVGDLLAAYAAPDCPLPLMVVRGYSLPAWAAGPGTLVVCLSLSGETEEVLSAFGEAAARGCWLWALAGGGALAAVAAEAGAVVWPLEEPVLATGFGLLLAGFARLGWLPNPAEALAEAAAVMQAQRAALGTQSPVGENEAKRLAGQCVGRWLAVFGADHLEPVARYWKMRLNKVSKSWAQCEALPEADHNTLVGVLQPAGMLGHTMLLFLRGRGCHPRNQLRAEVTKEFFMLEGLGTDFFNARGVSRLAQMWAALQFGDYLAYYLALAYGNSPAAMDAVDGLKAYLKTG